MHPTLQVSGISLYVDLSTAASFLSFDASTRRIQSLRQTTQVEVGSHKVNIRIAAGEVAQDY